MDSSNSADVGAVVKLTQERWIGSLNSLQNHHLMGCTVAQLSRILWNNRREIDFGIFAPRIAVLVLLSIVNSLFALLDWLFYSKAVSQTAIPPCPLFIIGQPRSGTTLLVNLFSLDEQFATPNTFQVGWGSSFLTLERFANVWPLSTVLSPTRPMDNMPLNWDTPQEDEVAINALSGGASPYLAISFMRSWQRFMNLVTFEGNEAEFARWKNAFLHLARKIAFKSPGRRLLFKSPVHTGRIKILQEMFGHHAQFVFVHRHPYDNFESNWRALADKYFRPYAALQTFDSMNAQQYILEHGRVLNDAYLASSRSLPPPQHVRVAFEDLCEDQVGTMRKIYKELGMEEQFEKARPAFEAHESQVADFKQNKFPPIDEQAKKLVQSEWSSMFTEFGYKP